MSKEPSVGFIGLGAMGAPMAAHVARMGLLRAVANRSRQRTEQFAAEHRVDALKDATELARDCSVIVSCVTADADVLAIARAITQAHRAGVLLIDTSTIASTSAQQAQTLLEDAGCRFVDAPISGGVEGARAATLSVMVGGANDDVARAKPVLECFAARVAHLGPVGAGQNAKAVNQVIVAGIAEAVCEGLALAKALGLDLDKLLPTLRAGAANSWFLERRGATMSRGSFAVGFKQALLLKDLKIVEALAQGVGIKLSVIEQTIADYGELVALGFGDDDISGLIRLKERKEPVSS